MAKKNDPFDKFREATLGGGNTLGAALSGGSEPHVERESIQVIPSPAVKKSKNSNRTLKSFHIDNELFKKLGQIKYENGISYDDLYNEAVRDLLVKYGKL